VGRKQKKKSGEPVGENFFGPGQNAKGAKIREGGGGGFIGFRAGFWPGGGQTRPGPHTKKIFQVKRGGPRKGSSTGRCSEKGEAGGRENKSYQKGAFSPWPTRCRGPKPRRAGKRPRVPAFGGRVQFVRWRQMVDPPKGPPPLSFRSEEILQKNNFTVPAGGGGGGGTGFLVPGAAARKTAPNIGGIGQGGGGAAWTPWSGAWAGKSGDFIFQGLWDEKKREGPQGGTGASTKPGFERVTSGFDPSPTPPRGKLFKFKIFRGFSPDTRPGPRAQLRGHPIRFVARGIETHRFRRKKRGEIRADG